MRPGLELLRRLVGRLVQAVTVNFWFFKDEQTGEAGDVSLALDDGRVLTFGCAGDGSVLITRGGQASQDAPNMTSIQQTIPGLCGELGVVESGDTWLRIQIGERTLQLTNLDDQLGVLVDEEGLPKEVYLSR
jgi:hypothetical protein